jgi:nitrate reductase assembly molybdenum cofactor insertion protein NarJ
MPRVYSERKTEVRAFFVWASCFKVSNAMTYHYLKWQRTRLFEMDKKGRLYIYYFVYTSLRVFTQPDKGKALVKLIKHLWSTFET